MLPGSGDDSVMGYLHRSYLEVQQDYSKTKAATSNDIQSILFARVRGCLVIFMAFRVFLFCLCSEIITLRSRFCLPSVRVAVTDAGIQCNCLRSRGEHQGLALSPRLGPG